MFCMRTTESGSPLISPPPPQTLAPSSNDNKIKRALRSLGCGSSASTDAAASDAAEVRSSAGWQEKRSRRRRAKQKKNGNKKERREEHHQAAAAAAAAAASAASSDVWCGRGFSDDSVDCVVRHHAMMTTMVRGGRHDAERIHREIMMLQTRMISGRTNAYDLHRDWRLDVDRMSYEELLELGDRIGYVNTGLREEEISRSLRKMKHSIHDASLLYYSSEMEKKCSICQNRTWIKECLQGGNRGSSDC